MNTITTTAYRELLRLHCGAQNTLTWFVCNR
jgi:hypothetical protein